MTINNTLLIILRCLLMSATMLLFTFLLLTSNNYISISIVAIALVIQIVLLIHNINKTNRQIALFFDSIKFNDYNSATNQQRSGQSFKQLSHSLNQLSQQFLSIRNINETQLQFNQNILQNVGVGIIAFTADGQIEFSNKLFHNMMGIPYCSNLEKAKRFNAPLIAQLTQIETRKKQLFKTEQNGLLQNYLLSASSFIVNNRNTTLVVVQNIQPTIDQAEMEAWQKLIRVLTHEIMNSITPISSLANTASTMLTTSTDIQTIDTETIADLQEALQTINHRSNGLISFVQQYRSLTSIPQPNLAIVSINELFLRISLLFNAEYHNSNIELIKEIDGSNLEVVADASLIEQVIINLLKNAFQALQQQKNGRIELHAHENNFQRIEIRIKDNGCGILPEVTDKIFIPFFTTKPAGSGIGLSLSKQIMLMHGGTISVTSTPNVGSTFVLKF